MLLSTLHHRGPDDQGTLAYSAGRISVECQGASLQNAELVMIHRRLSIIDLSKDAGQPMISADQRFAIVFNGEIYNYIELRNELMGNGVTFRTKSDTEVILEAFSYWGPACVKRFIGMFSFALLDSRERKLYLFRDFFGIKPLYYSLATGNFIFASEIKAFLALPGFPREIEPETLFRYLRWGITWNDNKTMLNSVQQVKPGHYLLLDLENPSKSEEILYWSIDTGQTQSITFDDATGQLRKIFDNNIRMHMRSDVPVGSALSGGIDSSTIVMTMRALRPEAEIHTFSFSSPGFAKDESQWASLVARKARTIHHPVSLKEDDLSEIIEQVIYSQDEPFGGTSILAQYAVFRAARANGIIVMLDGQGADEMLAGYSYYRGLRMGAMVAAGRLRDAVRLSIRSRTWPDYRFIDAARWGASMFMPAGMRSLGRRLTGKEFILPWIEGRWFKFREIQVSEGEQFFGCRTLKDCLKRCLTRGSVPDLLRYEDRNSMAHSIESRVPYLTSELADFVFSLPDDFFIGSDGRTKNLLRMAYEDLLPPEITNRKDKIGFETPEDSWMLPISRFCESTLKSDDFERILPVLSQKVHPKNLGELSETIPQARQRWRVMNLMLWARRFDVVVEA